MEHKYGQSIVSWDGVDRRSEPRNSEIIELIKASNGEALLWRKEVDDKLDCQRREFREFRVTHEPTLLRISKNADYWASVREEAVRKLVTAGFYAAVSTVLGLIMLGFWQVLKDHLK